MCLVYSCTSVFQYMCAVCIHVCVCSTQDAYNHGFINDQDLDLAMTRLFTQRSGRTLLILFFFKTLLFLYIFIYVYSHTICRMKLGMFDPPDIQPYFNISSSQVNTAASQVTSSPGQLLLCVLVSACHISLVRRWPWRLQGRALCC